MFGHQPLLIIPDIDTEEYSLEPEERLQNTHYSQLNQGGDRSFHEDPWSIPGIPQLSQARLIGFHSTGSGTQSLNFPQAEQFKTILVTQIEGESIFQANYWTEVEFIKPITLRCYGKGGKCNHI